MARSERGASPRRAGTSERRRQTPLLPRAPRVALSLALAGVARLAEMARISTLRSRLGQRQKPQQREPLQYFDSLLHHSLRGHGGDQCQAWPSRRRLAVAGAEYRSEPDCEESPAVAAPPRAFDQFSLCKGAACFSCSSNGGTGERELFPSVDSSFRRIQARMFFRSKVMMCFWKKTAFKSPSAIISLLATVHG